MKTYDFGIILIGIAAGALLIGVIVGAPKIGEGYEKACVETGGTWNADVPECVYE